MSRSWQPSFRIRISHVRFPHLRSPHIRSLYTRSLRVRSLYTRSLHTLVLAAALSSLTAPLPAQQPTAPAGSLTSRLTSSRAAQKQSSLSAGSDSFYAATPAKPAEQLAQATQPPTSTGPQSTAPGNTHGTMLNTPGASPVATPATAPSSQAKPNAGATLKSKLDDPPAPATIEVTGDQLSIKATNASLSEVLRQLATRTGMQIEGNSHDERVYGVYGPGSPADVLSALLYDSGYNILMVGSTTDGAPRRLVLSPRTQTVPAQVANTQPVHNDDEDDTAQEAPPPPPPQPTPAQGTSTSQPGQIKTPQQMLQELQQLTRQQQQQGQPQ